MCKIVSVVKDRIRGELFRLTETEGKNSLVFYPQNQNTVHFKGRKIGVRCAKIEYSCKTDTVTIYWMVNEGEL